MSADATVYTLAESPREMHHFHHGEPSPVTFSVKAEKNSRGVNWECSVHGATHVEDALCLLKQLSDGLEAQYNAKPG